MADKGGGSWAAPDVEIPVSKRLMSAERQLALVDRIIGLEAQLAELSASATLRPSEQLRVEQQLKQVQNSTSFRVGKMLVAPAGVAKYRLKRVLGR